MKNILVKLSVKIPATSKGDTICRMLVETLVNVDNIYSYLIYAEYDGNILEDFLVEFLVSQSEEYNTLEIEDSVADIALIIHNAIEQQKKKYVIGYKQPPLEIMLELYEPLVQTLARQQKTFWQKLELEDLCQICRMVICILYNAGYYLHKNLIQKAFTNEVLATIRKDKYAPLIVSMNKTIKSDEGRCEYGDLIPDTQALIQQQEDEEREAMDYILTEMKDLVIAEIGQRQYDSLLRDWRNGTTTGQSQKQVFRLKEMFKQLGITLKSFWR